MRSPGAGVIVKDPDVAVFSTIVFARISILPQMVLASLLLKYCHTQAVNKLNESRCFRRAIAAHNLYLNLVVKENEISSSIITILYSFLQHVALQHRFLMHLQHEM